MKNDLYKNNNNNMCVSVLAIIIYMYVKGWSLSWVSHLFFLNIILVTREKSMIYSSGDSVQVIFKSPLRRSRCLPWHGHQARVRLSLSDSPCRGVPASLMLSPERRRCSSQDVSRRWMNIAGRFAVASIRMQKLFIFPFLFFFRWKFVVSVKWLTLCLQEC